MEENTPNPPQQTQEVKPKNHMATATVLFALLFLVVLGLLAAAFRTVQPIDEVSLNDQLKADSNQLGLAIINYNQGRQAFQLLPEKVAELRITQLPREFNDPRTGQPYALTTAIPQPGELQFIYGGECAPDDSIVQSGDDENFAIRALLDTGLLYCIERSEVRPPTNE